MFMVPKDEQICSVIHGGLNVEINLTFLNTLKVFCKFSLGWRNVSS